MGPTWRRNMDLFTQERSECGTGWIFTRDIRQNILSPFGAHKEQINEMATRINCRHLLIKAEDFGHFEDGDDLEETLNIFRRNPLFQYRLLPGGHHLHMNNHEQVTPVILDFVRAISTPPE